MSSNQDQKAATDSSGGKQATPGDKTGPEKTDSHNADRRASGHEVTGAEKFAAAGGSGGVPLRGGQGYEAYANH